MAAGTGSLLLLLLFQLLGGCRAAPLGPADKALMDAAGEGDAKGVADAIEVGANVNCASPEAGETPLVRIVLTAPRPSPPPPPLEPVAAGRGLRAGVCGQGGVRRLRVQSCANFSSAGTLSHALCCANIALAVRSGSTRRGSGAR